MKYKLLSIDLDRTLLTPCFAKVTKKDALAIQKYLSAGGKVCINTGRAPWSAKKFIDYINSFGPNKIQFLSAYNGGYIYDYLDKETHIQTIPHGTVKRIYDLVLKHNAHIWIHSVNGEQNKSIETNKLIYKYFIKFFRSLNLIKVKDLNKLESFKMNIFSASKNKINWFYKDCCKLNLQKQATFCMSRPKVIEISPKNSNKGVILSMLSKKYKIDRSQIMSIGDSFNDKAAFVVSGYAIGVKPKEQPLEKFCNKVIRKNINAVSYIINNLVLDKNLKKK